VDHASAWPLLLFDLQASSYVCLSWVSSVALSLPQLLDDFGLALHAAHSVEEHFLVDQSSSELLDFLRAILPNSRNADGQTEGNSSSLRAN
jgi:hypothetical protein